ncbi:LexA family transcriptional regulator [Elizabethkingia anophelis]|uniref:XRE family transcriptional regulator n=1 Tax=Elizabethkingia anophelis TaxID=1117645 RepID=UPI0021A3C33F|nr:LexA family transcriptional regulator [Elizabethkingia anophelis]MCT3776193.1 LexA family transcriptional regulator [Elizabethkingia anophelis]MCT3783306.1 LexA family transcriptional regulator [Elizabethkingia anophelis]MCT3790237.1 LexA family transcriptional regulator [Elizabethkingia anophelis]MCT3793779.1 LexA family transcriptional regulator [Elizabethkingia anophelis]
MSIFSDNIVFLRRKNNITQQELADLLILTRSRYISYEYGRSEPPIEVLIRISKYYHISIDLLVTVDIRKYPLDQMVNLPDNKILLPVVVDPEGNKYIEIVPQKASMGYLKGFSDPEYIESLPRIQLPFLGHGVFRGFMAEGDSMPPFADGTCVIGEYVEQLKDLKAGKEYIFITREGYTFKTFVTLNKTTLTVAADNSFYDPYDIPLNDIVQVWRYMRGILPQAYKPDYPQEYSDLTTLVDQAKLSICNLEKLLLAKHPHKES